jgi:hypothetical protein
MFKTILSAIPFVCLSLLAPDTGAPSGGGNGDTPPADAPPVAAPPVVETMEAPTGDSIENKLTSALGIITNYFRRIGELMSQLSTAQDKATRATDQFNAVAGDLETRNGELKAEKEAHTKTQGALTQSNTDRDNANGNVERLEKICQLRGIDPNQAVVVPPAPKQAANTGAAKWEKYNELQAQEKKGEIASGTSFKYWKENRKDLDAYATAQRQASRAA